MKLLPVLLALLVVAPAAAQEPGQEWREGIRRVRVDDVTATHVHYTVLESEMTPATVGRSYKIQLSSFASMFTQAPLPVRVDTFYVELPPRVDTLVIAVPCLCDTVMQPPDTLPTEPSDTLPTEPPDSTLAADSVRVGFYRFDALSWDRVQWDSVDLELDTLEATPPDSALACAYAFLDGQVVEVSNPAECPMPTPADSVPTDPGAPDPELELLFADTFDGEAAPLETRAGWIRASGAGIIQTSGAGTAHSAREGSATLLASTPAPPGALFIRWGLVRLTDANYNPPGILVRADSAGAGGYSIAYTPGGRRHVIRTAAGVAIGTIAEPAIAVGEMVAYGLAVADLEEGTTFVLYRNGAEVGRVVDTTGAEPPTGRYFGLVRGATAYVTPTTGVHFTRFEVEGSQ